MLGRTLFAFVLLMIGASALVPLSLPHLGEEHDESGVVAVASVPAGCADCRRTDMVSASCAYACTAGSALVVIYGWSNPAHGGVTHLFLMRLPVEQVWPPKAPPPKLPSI